MSENRRALRLRVRLSGGAAEKEDDPQRHQQQEMEPDRKDHHQWRTGSTGMEISTGTEEGEGRHVIGYTSQPKKERKEKKNTEKCGDQVNDFVGLWH